MSLDSSIREIVDERTKLEEECWSCMRYGQRKKTPDLIDERGNCDRCGGRGTVLTAMGERVLEFVQARFHLVPK